MALIKIMRVTILEFTFHLKIPVKKDLKHKIFIPLITHLKLSNYHL